MSGEDVSRTLDRLGDLGARLLPWGVLGLMGVGVAGGHVSESLARLIQQNGAVLLLVAIIIQYAPRAIEAQNSQAAAMSDLSASVRELTTRDDYQRREVLGVLQVLAEDVRDMKREMRDHVARQESHDGQR